ncbi:MAG: 3-deoxy-7-phosphoheptulonate synthase [Gammaproteobacteria bacterium]|nr:3-deoxy-7-phosphoheptulonate synthase [Gammaproteobacteria bacterium]
MTELENINVERLQVLMTPERLKRAWPLSKAALASVAKARRAINGVLNRDDPRLLVVVGPCSIHDARAAKDYGDRLAALNHEVEDTLLLVMRAYFEKPRTTVGWKGLINDPYLDDSFRVADGLQIARRLLLELAELGLPLSTEALDPITPQYLQDLISWSAIGARTSESQTHREMASGLSSAVGFKNGTDGSLDAAINALASVAEPHRFLGINPAGQVAVIETRGNPNAHMVLRGGANGPNYDRNSVYACEAAMRGAGLRPTIMVDCSHANSGKDPAAQPAVARAVLGQVREGSRSIVGIMLESHIHSGSQRIPDNLDELRYGVSVTDGCIDWPTTEALLREAADALRPALSRRVA